MNIRKKILTRCGALLTAVLALAPTALAAEAEIPYIPQTVPAAQLAPADQRGQAGLAAAAGEPLAHGAGGI